MGTSVPTVTFGATGFLVPSTLQVMTGVIEDIQGAFGGVLNLDVNVPASLKTSQGQWATSWTAQITNSNNAFLLQSQMTDPAYAFGRWQDAIGRIYFIERKPAQPTALQVACNGAQNVQIPLGAIIQDPSGNLYACTQSGTIPAGGSITLSFAAQVAGPTAVPPSVSIKQTIFQWDSVAIVSGVVGSNVESRAEFEVRRQDTVAGNSFGAIGSIIGAVAEVPSVLDYFGFNNNTNAPVTLNGVTIAANAIYICVAGGAPADVAAAIFSKKGGGAPMTGNTTVTVFDNNPLYSAPVPYQITYEIPNALQILFDVVLVSSPAVPSDANTLVQAALVAAFQGTTLSASFIASITGTILTVTEIDSGTIVVGQTLSDLSGLVVNGTTILGFITGEGGVGTYTISQPQTVVSEQMTTESLQSTTSNIPKARINSLIFAAQYVSAIAALGPWAQVARIFIGSSNNPDAVFFGFVNGNTLTVTQTVTGAIVLNDAISDPQGILINGTFITQFGTGTGGVGTYLINNAATLGASFTGTGSGTNLTATAVTGTIAVGDTVIGTGVPAGTTIVSQTSGTPGGAGVYVTSHATTSTSAALSAGEQITAASASNTSVQVNANQEPQLIAPNILVSTT
jgi:hypothetical protein